MFNDRDLAVIGLGAVGAVVCLLLPLSFSGKVAAGSSTLVVFLFLALARFGYDRLPFEKWLLRRARYGFRPRFWTFQIRNLLAPKTVRLRPDSTLGASPEPTSRTASKMDSFPEPAERSLSPMITFKLEQLRAERIASSLLVVGGIYFLSWLWTSGAVRIGLDLGIFLP